VEITAWGLQGPIYKDECKTGRATNFRPEQDGYKKTGDNCLVFFRTGDIFLGKNWTGDKSLSEKWTGDKSFLGRVTPFCHPSLYTGPLYYRGALIRTGQRTGQKSFFCKSGQARIGQATILWCFQGRDFLFGLRGLHFL